jgi:hypothetical protein
MEYGMTTDNLLPEIRIVEHHGTVVLNNITLLYETLDEHWIVNGKRFLISPTEDEIRNAYNDSTPHKDPNVLVEAAKRILIATQHGAIPDEDMILKLSQAVQEWEGK